MNLQNLLSNTSSDRNNLKPNFNTGEIPTQTDFHTLIDGLFRLRDDSIYKDADNGLCIKAGADADTTALLLYDDFNDPKWSISIKDGFHIKGGASGHKQLSIRNGNIGIGTSKPVTRIHINHDGASDYGVGILINQFQPGNGDGPKVQFQKATPGGYKSWTIGINNGLNNKDFTIGENGGHDLGWGGPRLVIKEGGNVGIGTDDPKGKLHLVGDLVSRWGIKFEHYESTWQPGRINQTWLRKTWTGALGDLLYLGSTGNRPVADQHAIIISEKAIVFGTAHQDGNQLTNEHLRIKENGNISITKGIETDGWTTPSLLNGFQQYGGGWERVGYYKDKMGRVHVRGLVRNGSANKAIFILPAGYRPARTLIFNLRSDNPDKTSRVDVLNNGEVKVHLQFNATWVSLNFSFRR